MRTAKEYRSVRLAQCGMTQASRRLKRREPMGRNELSWRRWFAYLATAQGRASHPDALAWTSLREPAGIWGA